MPKLSDYAESMGDELIEKVAEAPAKVVDKTIGISTSISESVIGASKGKRAIEYWKTLGPGFTTGAADDDPSGIATYSQQGAQYGFQLLWMALFSFPLMAIIQEMCGRIGVVTNRGLAANIKRNYPKWVLLSCSFLLLGANTLNLGADIGAMAKSVQLLAPGISFTLLIVAFTVFITLLQIYTTYKTYAKYLKYLALILVAYILSALSIKDINWIQVITHGIVPSITFSKGQIFLITAILGTTISPYLFFWQTSQEVEEKMEEKRMAQGEVLVTSNTINPEDSKDRGIKNLRIDTWSGMFVSNLVMFFIIITTAATLFTHGITNINTASDAAQALKPLAGDFAYLLFALGIIGTGLLAVPVLAGSASYALSESFQWKSSLSRKLKDAYAFYGVIIIAMIIGLLINIIGFDPIKTLIYSAVINGLIAPIILFLIVQMSSSEKIMGRYKNNPAIKTIGWITVGIMTLTAVATIVSSFFS